MPNCECEACVQGRRLRDIIGKLEPDDAAWLKEFGSEYLSVSTDEQYYRNIVDGSWPNAVFILERALARAKEREASKPF